MNECNQSINWGSKAITINIYYILYKKRSPVHDSDFFQRNQRETDPTGLIYLFIFRFMVRDFLYNEEEMKADKEEMTRLSTDKKKQFVCVQLSVLNIT